MTMAALKLNPRDSRIAAILLLLLALLLAYFVLLYWWFVAPLQQISGEMADLRDTQGRYAAAIAEKPMLQQRLAALGAGQAASAAFLPDDDPNTAAADLMQRVVDVVGNSASSGGNCAVSQKMPMPNPPATPGEPYRKAAVSINLSCDIESLASVLHELEQGMPYVFIDDLSIYRNPVAAQQNHTAPLEVQFNVSGYLRPSHGSAPAAAPVNGTPGMLSPGQGAAP